MRSVTEEQRSLRPARAQPAGLLDLWRCRGVARRSKIHKGYSPSSRPCSSAKSPATRPLPIYEIGSTSVLEKASARCRSVARPPMQSLHAVQAHPTA